MQKWCSWRWEITMAPMDQSTKWDVQNLSNCKQARKRLAPLRSAASYESNILAEYRVPRLTGVFFNLDGQHVGCRAIDDINGDYTPQYSVLDLGIRYTTRIAGKPTTFRVTSNNATDVHYWSTLGPGSITGQSTGSYLAHLGEPRLLTASIRYAF
jgi:iron complex outermembrane recepter protein